MIISAQSQNIVTEESSEIFSMVKLLMLISVTFNMSLKGTDWKLASVFLIKVC